MQDHRSLRVYEAAQKLGVEIYALTPALPPSERFALADQLQRAAVSIASDIAEGSGRATPPDFCNCLDRALGSAREVESQLVHARAVGLLPGRQVSGPLGTCLVVQRMLTALILTIRTRNTRKRD